MNIIRCNVIDYRKGFIEVQSRIHDGCINIETWQTAPDIDITGLVIGDEKITDDDVTGNAEIELSLENAEHLVAQLQNAINDIKSEGST